MSPKIDAPYLWIRPFCLVPLNLASGVTMDHHGPSIHSGHYTASIDRCKKHSIATIIQLRSLKLFIAKTTLLHMLYCMNWLTYEFWTRTDGMNEKQLPNQNGSVRITLKGKYHPTFCPGTDPKLTHLTLDKMTSTIFREEFSWMNNLYFDWNFTQFIPKIPTDNNPTLV